MPIASADPGLSATAAEVEAQQVEWPSGEEALDALEGRIDEVAADHGLTGAELESLLADDSTLHVGPGDELFFADEPLDPQLVAAASIGAEPVARGPFPYAKTFKLHSKPGSARTIYLDFNGHTASNTIWNPVFGISGKIVAKPFSLDGNAAFSNREKDFIQDVWLRMAEDFAPFDVNVTTAQPTAAALKRSSSGDAAYGTRIVITNSSFINSGGVAMIGAFNRIGAEHDYGQPAWCFAQNLSHTSPGGSKYVAECASHEVGHTLGLLHDGKGGSEYYLGHPLWAPIMGAGYFEPVTQWSKGEYSGATQRQDDYAVMSRHGVKRSPDDHANGRAMGTDLGNQITGVVGSATDVDFFTFVARQTGTATFTATPAGVSPNLDIRMQLIAANGSVLATHSPTAVRIHDDLAIGMDATITRQVVKGTKYHIRIEGSGVGNANNGYTRYGSLGRYTLRVTGQGQATMCGDRVATIVGTPGNDTINGTAGNDVIHGLGGNDTIDGRGGNDVICGGGGNDTLIGGNGNDILRGGPGNDTLRGGAGADELWGEGGTDRLFGGAGNDKLYGGNGADTLNGDGGNDELRGGAGNDTLKGGPGADKLWGEGGADALDGGGGTDVCNGGPGVDTAVRCETRIGIP